MMFYFKEQSGCNGKQLFSGCLINTRQTLLTRTDNMSTFKEPSQEFKVA